MGQEGELSAKWLDERLQLGRHDPPGPEVTNPALRLEADVLREQVRECSVKPSQLVGGGGSENPSLESVPVFTAGLRADRSHTGRPHNHKAGILDLGYTLKTSAANPNSQRAKPNDQLL